MTDHPTAPVQDDDAKMVRHARRMREQYTLPNGVGNTIDALCDIIERLSPTPETGLVEASLPQMLDELAARESESVAQHLEDLRNRLGKDGLSTDEWNALVGAASHLRIDAWRRSQRALSNVLPDEV